MDLFEIIKGHLYPSIHALMVEPFKSMWEQDSSEDHYEVLRVFQYIELFCSPKKSNIFASYIDDQVREKLVKREVFKDENYPTTSDMMLGVMKYVEILGEEAISYSLYIDSVTSAERLRTWLNDFDLDSTTNSGAMKLKPKDVTAALLQVPEVIKKLEESRKTVVSELNDSTKTRNNRIPGPYEL